MRGCDGNFHRRRGGWYGIDVNEHFCKQFVGPYLEKRFRNILLSWREIINAAERCAKDVQCCTIHRSFILHVQP